MLWMLVIPWAPLVSLVNLTILLKYFKWCYHSIFAYAGVFNLTMLICSLWTQPLIRQLILGGFGKWWNSANAFKP